MQKLRFGRFYILLFSCPKRRHFFKLTHICITLNFLSCRIYEIHHNSLPYLFHHCIMIRILRTNECFSMNIDAVCSFIISLEILRTKLNLVLQLNIYLPQIESTGFVTESASLTAVDNHHQTTNMQYDISTHR
jgi:hypothetical protein